MPESQLQWYLFFYVSGANIFIKPAFVQFWCPILADFEPNYVNFLRTVVLVLFFGILKILHKGLVGSNSASRQPYSALFSAVQFFINEGNKNENISSEF